jgi:hypothetical protein
MIIKLRQNPRRVAAKLFRIPVILFALCSFCGTTAHAIPINAVTISGGSVVNPNTPTVVGWIFKAEQNINVTALGMWDESGDGFAASSLDVGLWDVAGNLLASTSVNSGNTLTNGFRFASIGSTSLTAGTNYVVGGLAGPSDQYRATATVANSAGVSWLGARFVNGTSLAFPTNTFVNTAGWFGANFQYDQPAAAPVPATLALFGLGLVGVGWSRRRTN